MRARPILYVATTLAFALATACGLNVTGSGSAQSEEATNSNSIAAEPTADAAASVVTTFACGSDTCTAGVQACCATGSTFACSAGDAGCPIDDSGAPAPPPMWCTSSAECGEERSCCYRPATGSACAKDCGADQVELCSLGKEGCGENASCVRMNVAPAPGVGQCQHQKS